MSEFELIVDVMEAQGHKSPLNFINAIKEYEKECGPDEHLMTTIRTVIYVESEKQSNGPYDNGNIKGLYSCHTLPQFLEFLARGGTKWMVRNKMFL